VGACRGWRAASVAQLVGVAAGVCQSSRDERGRWRGAKDARCRVGDAFSRIHVIARCTLSGHTLDEMVQLRVAKSAYHVTARCTHGLV
jgi:hypothetical protein